MIRILLFICTLLYTSAWADVNSDRKYAITAIKKGVYVDQGIWTKKGEKKSYRLEKVKHYFDARKGSERTVFVFAGNEVPQMYAKIGREEKKIFLDLFGVSIAPNLASDGQSTLLKNILFFPIEKEILSVEMQFSGAYYFDLFFLTSPARLVIDVIKSN